MVYVAESSTKLQKLVRLSIAQLLLVDHLDSILLFIEQNN